MRTPPRPRRARPRAAAVAIAVLAGVIVFVFAIQVRSQAAVEQTLQGQDNTALAFLIDDLHKANDALAAQAAELQTQRSSLQSPGGGSAALADEAQRLRVLEGLVPVTGPGVVLTIDAPLQPLDLQDGINNLRLAGAEAIEINGRRVVTGSAIAFTDGAVTIDGAPVHGPWTIVAIGDPIELAATADLMTSNLRADTRVRVVTYRSGAVLRITAVLTQRPYVYGSY